MVMSCEMVVFGGSGGLGSPLSESLGKEYNIKSLSSREVDVTSFSEVKLFFEAHKPRVIINLSGYSYNTVLHKYDGEDLHLSKQIKVNIEGNLNILGCCLPYMREAGYGRIILASSVLSSRPAFGTGVYSGCKAFIDNLDGGLTYQVPEKFRNIVKDRIPLKRWGHISEIENAIRYLINTEYVSGCSLKINGGLEF